MTDRVLVKRVAQFAWLAWLARHSVHGTARHGTAHTAQCAQLGTTQLGSDVSESNCEGLLVNTFLQSSHALWHSSNGTARTAQHDSHGTARHCDVRDTRATVSLCLCLGHTWQHMCLGHTCVLATLRHTCLGHTWPHMPHMLGHTCHRFGHSSCSTLGPIALHALVWWLGGVCAFRCHRVFVSRHTLDRARQFVGKHLLLAPALATAWLTAFHLAALRSQPARSVIPHCTRMCGGSVVCAFRCHRVFVSRHTLAHNAR
jgi:hypothetical protein